MQALTGDIRAEYPGVVIYGKGDDEHQLRTSDHNEDDTAGSRPAQSDADSNPEHRAIDVMIGPAMTVAQLQGLVERVVAAEVVRERQGGKPRLFYVIFNGWIWSRSNNWVKQPKTDNPHRDHAHFSGWAAGDEIAERWPAVSREDDMLDPNDPEWAAVKWRQYAMFMMQPRTLHPKFPEDVPIVIAIKQMQADVAKLSAPAPVVIDYARLAAEIAKVLPSAGAIAAAVGDREAAADRARADVLDGE